MSVAVPAARGRGADEAVPVADLDRAHGCTPSVATCRGQGDVSSRDRGDQRGRRRRRDVAPGRGEAVRAEGAVVVVAGAPGTVADAVHLRVVGAAGKGPRQRRAHPGGGAAGGLRRGGVVGRDHLPETVEEREPEVEVGLGRQRARGDRHGAGAGPEQVGVDVGAAVDVRRPRGDLGRGEDDARGLVGARPDDAADDRDVVLLVRGTGVVALAPLADRAVVAHAHDRSPGAVAAVVALRGVAVVLQAEVVPDLVGHGLGDVLRGVAELLREDPRRLAVAVAVPTRAEGLAEDVDVGHAPAGAPVVLRVADRLVGADARGDQCVGAVRGVQQARPVDPVGPGVGRGHVDVEGRVVLGHGLPDRLDRGALGVVEDGGVAAGVPGRLAGRRRGMARVPPRRARRATVEVEEDRLRRPRLAVQLEGLRQRRLGADRVVGRRGRDAPP